MNLTNDQLEKLKYYQSTLKFPNKELSNLGFFALRKFSKTLIKCLPKYCENTGKRIDWCLSFRETISQKFDSITGKRIKHDAEISKIFVEGYVKRDIYYEYDIEKGTLYYIDSKFKKSLSYNINHHA